MVRHNRIELLTPWLKVRCSTNWANVSDSYWTVNSIALPILPFTEESIVPSFSRTWVGAGDRIRTCDLRLTRSLLCQLSYTSIWSSQRESNSQHPAWRAGTLPIELWLQMIGWCQTPFNYSCVNSTYVLHIVIDVMDTLSNGSSDGTWTHTLFSNWFWVSLVCLFRHTAIFNTLKTQLNEYTQLSDYWLYSAFWACSTQVPLGFQRMVFLGVINHQTLFVCTMS